MSSQKTPVYQFHSWLPEDNFLREEINANFTALENVLLNKEDKGMFVFGTYTGDGTTSKFISLGFTPRMVLVINEEGEMGSDSARISHQGGMVLPGIPLTSGNSLLLGITSGGFTVGYAGNSLNGPNLNNYLYYYMAVK